MGERAARLLALGVGTVVLVVFLLCSGEFMFRIGLDPIGLVFRVLALLFLGIAPIAGLWDFSQRGQREG